MSGTRSSNRPAAGLAVEFVPVEYDHERLAGEMRDEKLPEEFVETVLTGWWTTCLEVLPAKERKRGNGDNKSISTRSNIFRRIANPRGKTRESVRGGVYRAVLGFREFRQPGFNFRGDLVSSFTECKIHIIEDDMLTDTADGPRHPRPARLAFRRRRL